MYCGGPVGPGHHQTEQGAEALSLEPYQHLDAGVYRLQMESNTCTLRLWKAYIYGLVWQSTGGAPVSPQDISVCKLTLHKNGNLVISSPSNPVIWQSNAAYPVDVYCRLELKNVMDAWGTAAVFCSPYAYVPLWSIGIPLWSTGVW